MTAAPLSASPRDASWYRNPDVRAPKAVHVDLFGDGFAACNSQMLLCSDSVYWRDCADVPADLRCRRPACRRAFAAAAADSGGSQHG